MHYVKQFNINGVDVRQVACIELQGPPNAATEGAVGVLGMDVTSPTREMYICVEVKGNIYTWKPLTADILDGGITTYDVVISEFENLTTEYLNSLNLKPNSRIYVKVDIPIGASLLLSIPETVSIIDFGGCTYSDTISLRIIGTTLDYEEEKFSTHIRNLYFDAVSVGQGYLEIAGMAAVEHCGCVNGGLLPIIQNDIKVLIRDCYNVTNCTATTLKYCQMVSNCNISANPFSSEIADVSHCTNISNVSVFETEFSECRNISNVRRYGAQPIVYDACTYVDGDTCDDYYTAQEVGQVQVITADGTKQTKSVYSIEEIDEEFMIVNATTRHQADLIINLSNDVAILYEQIGLISERLTALHEGGIE